MRRQLLAVLLLTLLAAAALDRLADADLLAHMVGQHAILAVAGATAAAIAQRTSWLLPVYRAVIYCPVATALIFLAIILGWHTPVLFGYAAAHASVHALMHLAYVGFGFGFGASLPALGAFIRALILIGTHGIMTALGIGMLTGVVLYPGYPPDQIATTGAAMILGMQVIWLALPLTYRFTAARH